MKVVNERHAKVATLELLKFRRVYAIRFARLWKFYMEVVLEVNF